MGCGGGAGAAIMFRSGRFWPAADKGVCVLPTPGDVSFLVVLASCRRISTRRRRWRWQDKRLYTFDVPEHLRRFPLILRFLFAGYLLALAVFVLCVWCFMRIVLGVNFC